jgi:hypothetical protein
MRSFILARSFLAIAISSVLKFSGALIGVDHWFGEVDLKGWCGKQNITSHPQCLWRFAFRAISKLDCGGDVAQCHLGHALSNFFRPRMIAAGKYVLEPMTVSVTQDERSRPTFRISRLAFLPRLNQVLQTVRVQFLGRYPCSSPSFTSFTS